MSNRIKATPKEPVPVDRDKESAALRGYMRRRGLSRGQVAQLLFDGATEDATGAVALAWVHPHTVSYSWHESVQRLRTWDLYSHGRLWDGGYVAIRGGTDGLAWARNTAVAAFLADHTPDWLLWVDTDAGFQPDTLDRLMEVADPIDRPVVGALAFANRLEVFDGMGGHRPVAWPTIMDWSDASESWIVRYDYPRDEVTRTHGTGSHCILIHRSVFERMRDAYQGQQPGWMGWYSRIVRPRSGELVSEDLSFCARLMQLGIPLHVHTGVKTTHHRNEAWLNEDDYWRARALDAYLRKASHPHPYEPRDEPETDPTLVSVLVPYRAPEGSHRAALKTWTEQAWKTVPGVEVIYADDGGEDGEPFNVSRAVNRARAQASAKHLVVFGCDHVPPSPDRMRWIRELLDRLPWAGVYDRTLELTAGATGMVLVGDDQPADRLYGAATIPACQGIIAVRAEVWDEIGGMDERFTGWGYEDTAFREALTALYPDGHGAGDGHVLTLWHPPASRAGTPSNEALYLEYVQAASEGRMRDYLDSLR